MPVVKEIRQLRTFKKAYHIPHYRLHYQVTCKDCSESAFKMVLHRSHWYFFGVKVKTVKLIGGRRFFAARSGLIYMNAQMIQTMAFTQIMDIWRPGRSVEDHLNWHINIWAGSLFSEKYWVATLKSCMFSGQGERLSINYGGGTDNVLYWISLKMGNSEWILWSPHFGHLEFGDPP